MTDYSNPQQHRILILDFGAQYTQLIGRCIRELGVYCEIFPWDVEEARIAEFDPNGIILSGGPASTYDDETPMAPDSIFLMNLPLLGICYGMQTMVAQLGGQVENADHREFGAAEVRMKIDSPLAGQQGQTLKVWMSHGDRVSSLPPGFDVLGTTSSCPYAVIADSSRQFYGVQFHPEVTHTERGKEMLSAFVHDICGCRSDWIASNIIDEQIREIRNQVGSDHVILGLSGGVDSSVVAALLHRAIGSQLTCIFVDTGLLRLDEGDQVMDTFVKNLGVTVIRVNAEQEFLGKLEGVTDPEDKRKIIGNLFVAIFERESRKIDNAKWLAQGTIYPDVIESAGNKRGKAKVIKSHHNVGGLPDDMDLSLLEPIRDLFKDEVRRIGIELGLPESMVFRHPFPGPGLGVRI